MNWPELRRQYFENFSIIVNGTGFEFKKGVSPGTIFEWFKNKLESNKRSSAQNRALHKYCKMIAEQCNNAGYIHVGKTRIQMPFSMRVVKYSYWSEVMYELYGYDSTTKLKKNELDPIIDSLSLTFGELGIHVEFPSWQGFLNKLDSNYL
jgi:hypothetical protein